MMNFSILSIWRAQKDHTHKPWTPSITADGVYYPTKEEAEYPPLLCKRVTALVVEELERLGWVRPETCTDQIKVNRNTAVNSVAMGILPRGQKLRPLVNEFSDHLRFAVLPHFNADTIVSKQLKGARITHRKLLTWGELRVSSLEKVSLEFLGDTKDLTDSVTVELISLEALLKSSAGLLRLERLWNRRILNFMRRLGKRLSSKKSEDGFGQMTAGSSKKRSLPIDSGSVKATKCGSSTTSSSEKFVLHGIDYIAATLIRALVYGQLGPGLEICGKTFDLKSAYKQYPIHQADRDHLRIAILDPLTKKPRLFGLNALPFWCYRKRCRLLTCELSHFLHPVGGGSRFGAVPSLMTFQHWRQKLCPITLNDVLDCCLTCWAYSTHSLEKSANSSPRRCERWGWCLT